MKFKRNRRGIKDGWEGRAYIHTARQRLDHLNLLPVGGGTPSPLIRAPGSALTRRSSIEELLWIF